MLRIPEHRENTSTKTVTKETKEDCLLFVIEASLNYAMAYNYFSSRQTHNRRRRRKGKPHALTKMKENFTFLELFKVFGRGVEQLESFSGSQFEWIGQSVWSANAAEFDTLTWKENGERSVQDSIT